MSLLFAVDPGSRCTGLAVFRDKRLVEAHALKARGSTPEARVVDVVRATVAVIEAAVAAHGGGPVGGIPTGGVVEMPQVYRHGPGAKVDPDDLLLLALVVGGLLCCTPWLEWKRHHPAEWKGQAPKEIMVARVLKHLDDGERALVKKMANDDHNAVDAVGLGLWALSRR